MRNSNVGSIQKSQGLRTSTIGSLRTSGMFHDLSAMAEKSPRYAAISLRRTSRQRLLRLRRRRSATASCIRRHRGPCSDSPPPTCSPPGSLPHGLARFDGEAAFLHLLQGRRGRREDDVLREGPGHALREDELVHGDRAVEDALCGPPQDVDGLRDSLAELRRGRREAELSEYRFLADVDELRGVVLS